jgi:hypothetical protein
MEQIEFVKSGLMTSRIGLGTWAMGGWMWGGTDEAQSIATIHSAIDRGVTLIDAAPVCSGQRGAGPDDNWCHLHRIGVHPPGVESVALPHQTRAVAGDNTKRLDGSGSEAARLRGS